MVKLNLDLFPPPINAPLLRVKVLTLVHQKFCFAESQSLHRCHQSFKRRNHPEVCLRGRV